MSKYIVVEFQTNEVAVVSEKWLTTDADERKNVLWPPYKSTSKINMAVRQHLEPEDSWMSCGIRRVMYSAESYEKAQQKAKEAEVESDSQIAHKRKHRPNPRFLDSDSESEDELRKKRLDATEDSVASLHKPPEKIKIPERPKCAAPTVIGEQQKSQHSRPSSHTLTSEQLSSQRMNREQLSSPRPSMPMSSSSSSRCATPTVIGEQQLNHSLPSSPTLTGEQLSSQRMNREQLSSPRPSMPMSSSSSSMSASSIVIGELPSSPTLSGEQLSSPRQNREQLSSPRPSMQIPSSSSSRLSSLDRTQTVVLGRDIAILRSLEEIKQEQREIKSMLATLIQRQSGPVGSADLPDSVTLPVANVEAMHALEEKLRDDTTMQVMVDYHANIGGSSLKIMIKRLMAEVLDNQLAVEFNLTGRGKMAFQSLKLCSVIQRAVSRNFPHTTNNESEYFIKDWLRNASDRNGGR